ncbi:MAG TPA: citrate synthase [Spirochaetota bacterium]|nr:citrate synthase [Spirochaetota bacterium]HPI90162.1 citrate synthase [Spirochaetota bacterium]HPR48921.1 citrate synthase [Spirochaetota bacterium]
MDNILSKIEKLTIMHDHLTPELIREKDVKLGLRNPDGTGVVVGITTKGTVVGYNKIPDKKSPGKYITEPVVGKLFYCGYDVSKIVAELEKSGRFGYDEIVFLLLTGELPAKKDLAHFSEALAKRRSLSRTERRIIMEEFENDNQMFWLHNVISEMARGDATAESRKIEDVLTHSINLIAKCPTVVAYNYCVRKYRKGGNLKLLRPRADLSTAENFLFLLKGEEPDPYEARLFDLAMILHAEHGGGNNSTFAVRTVTSSGASTYMAIAAGVASLSGPLHGGANESVMKMMKDLKKNVKDLGSDKQIRQYLVDVLKRKKGDQSGKIFGFGHAVYTLSDPRAIIFEYHAKKLAEKHDCLDEFYLYEKVSQVAVDLLRETKGTIHCPNVDFWSGFIYKMMGIPTELFTPIFAMARVSGWVAHRLEQIVQGKIIRPAYIAVSNRERDYTAIDKR